MSDLYELEADIPEMDRPVLLMALDGWIDSGGAAAAAMALLLRTAEPTLVATFDSDVLLDHRARRPTLRISNGQESDLEWPTLRLHAGTDRSGGDLLLLSGPEPDHSWHRFAQDVANLALSFDAKMVLGLGAYPAPVPHTREARVVATSADGEWARGVGVSYGTIDIPAGVQVAIAHACHQVGVPSLGLWAQVPHYAAAMPYPTAGAALLRLVPAVSGLAIEPAPLATEGEIVRARLDAAVADNPEHRQMLAELERSYDETTDERQKPDLIEHELPTGDELAAELQRFLRDQDDD